VQSVLEDLQAQHAANFGWALTCCAWQRDLADDVLQEAYLRVLDGRAKYSGRSTIKTWFFAVIKQVAADVQRTLRRRSILNLQVVSGNAVITGDATPEYSETLADALYADESSQQLRAALMALSIRQREVLHLVFYAELTLVEAAMALDISVGSVRTHYHRGKERLSALLSLGESDEQ
jgi:RNA polymerase sigma factor (sigma-70 family)